MRRLKSKYKWEYRENRFKVLKQDSMLAEFLLNYMPIFGLSVTQQILNLKYVLPLPDETFKFITDSLEKMIKSRTQETQGWKFRPHPEFDEIPRTCLADKSALEKEGGTTIPLSKESSHLSDEFDDRYGAWGLVRRTKHHHFVMLDTSKD